MRLSEAIMKGSKLRPQTFGKERDAQGTCALGAAVDATGISLGCLFVYFPIASKPIPLCPKCDRPAHEKPDVWTTIIHLNDDHKAEREWIAMWVKEIEDKMEAGLL